MLNGRFQSVRFLTPIELSNFPSDTKIIKKQALLQFTVNSQSKLKKFSTLFLRYLPRKTHHFVKNYYLNLNFFQVLQSALLKKQQQQKNKNKKNLLKEDASHLKIARHSKRRKKDIEKRERKTKNEKKSNINNSYFFFCFYFFFYKRYYIFLENMFGKVQFILLHLYYSFSTW